MHLDSPGPQCEIHVHQMGGAVGARARQRDGVRGAVDAVRAQRRHGLARRRPGRRPGACGLGPRCIAAAGDAATGRAYVNFLTDPGAARAAYGEDKYARLVALKNAYDPTNVFRLNQNIAPDENGG